MPFCDTFEWVAGQFSRVNGEGTSYFSADGFVWYALLSLIGKALWKRTVIHTPISLRPSTQQTHYIPTTHIPDTAHLFVCRETINQTQPEECSAVNVTCEPFGISYSTYLKAWVAGFYLTHESHRVYAFCMRLCGGVWCVGAHFVCCAHSADL